MSSVAAAIGRILIAFIFIVSGVTKLTTIAQTDASMVSAGLPAGLAVPVGVFELVVGLCLAIGLMTRLASLLLIVFVALATVLFHNRFTDPDQAAHAMKNLAIMGGLLAVFAHSQMRWSYDWMRAERRRAVDYASANTRTRDAELSAARAEGAAAALADADVAPHPVRRRNRWF